MKILLLSDIHFGVKKNSEFFLNVIKEFFDNMVIPTIEKYNVEEVWILGDLFEDKFQIDVLIENTAINIMQKILSKFKNLKIFILCGNHDIYYKNSLKISSLKSFEKINKRLTVIKDVIEHENGCKILAVPWLIHGSKNWTEFKRITSEYEESNIKKYDLCFGHFEISGFEMRKGLLNEDGLTQSIFDAFQDVYSGHFHIRGKQKNIQYLGSPYEINWNDYGTEKGVTIYDTEKRKEIFIENDISPKHKTIKLSSILKDKSIIDDTDNNMIRFYIDETIDETKLNNIIESLNSKKIFNLQTIDERYDVDIDDEDIDIDEVIAKDDLEYSLEYIKKLEHPDEIKIDDLEKRIIKYYTKAIEEIETA